MREVDRYRMSDAQTAQCPFVYYAAMRREEPVHRDPGTGIYWVTRHDDVVAAALDAATFSSRSEIILKKRFRRRAQSLWDEAGMEAVDTFITGDPPEHDDYRAIGVRLFDMRKVEEMTPHIERLVHELIDAFVARGEADFLHEFAAALPGTVVCDEFGFPRQDLPRFKTWMEAVIGMLTPGIDEDREVELIKHWIELFRYLDTHIKRAASEPSGRVIHALATLNKKDGTPFSMLERSWMATATFIGGNETTMNMLTAGMRRLALSAELQDGLRGDAAKIDRFVEELLRFEGSVQGLLRVATRDVELHGTLIPKGANVVLCVGAANRDEARWDDADAFRLDRPEGNRHLAFGYGRHACIGMQLARRELKIAFRVLLDRLREIRLAVPESEIVQLPLPFHRGVGNLPLRFSAI